MFFTATQFISLSVVAVGVLMVLEAIVLIGGKGIDVNGELPFMAFGTLFIAAMPYFLNLLGPWEKSWYWYIFIGFLAITGFTAYIRSRGYTIRIIDGHPKSVYTGIENALKAEYNAFTKEDKSLPEGLVTKYTIEGGKYPIFVTIKKRTAFFDKHIEIVAPEALWNKELQIRLTAFAVTSRSGRTTQQSVKSVLPRFSLGGLLIFLGIFLMNF